MSSGVLPRALGLLPDPYAEFQPQEQVEHVPLFRNMCSWFDDDRHKESGFLFGQLKAIKSTLRDLSTDAVLQARDLGGELRFFEFMVACVCGQNLYGDTLTQQSEVDSMPVIGKKRLHPEPLEEENKEEAAVPDAAGMVDCSIVVKSSDVNIWFTKRSLRPRRGEKNSYMAYSGVIFFKEGQE